MEDKYNNYAPTAIPRGHYHSASSEIQTTQQKPIDAQVEINKDHQCFPKATISSLEERHPVDVRLHTNHGRCSPVSTSRTKEYGNSDKAPSSINHNHYRFAYDLVEKVLEIRAQLNPHVTHNLPEPQKYLFTAEHRNVVTTILSRDAGRLVMGISSMVNGIYNYENYLNCRNYFVEKFKNRVYTENQFISACATIAYIAAYFTQNNYHCGALDDAVHYIACWIVEILQHGTIDNSRW